MGKFSILAIIPAYNEARKIGSTIEKTLPYADQICVVDDGSDDDTGAISSTYPVHLIRHKSNQGKGKAIRTGIDYFLSTSHDITIFVDADGQHDPRDIPKFIRYFDNHPHTDIVVASRFGTDQWQNNMPFLRKLSNLLSRFGLWVLYNGLVVEDPQNGYRAFNRQSLQHIRFTTNGYEAETEMIIDAHLKGFDIGRIHIESIYDDNGNSSKFSVFLDTWKIPGVMVKNFFKRKPFLLKSRQNKLRYRELTAM